MHTVSFSAPELHESAKIRHRNKHSRMRNAIRRSFQEEKAKSPSKPVDMRLTEKRVLVRANWIPGWLRRALNQHRGCQGPLRTN